MNLPLFHYMQLPREIIIGKDVLKNVIKVCKGLGFHNSVFALTDPTIYDLTAFNIITQFEKNHYNADFSLISKSDINTVKEVMNNIFE